MKTRRSDADQKRADDRRLLCSWRKWHAECLAEALTGPHASILAQLVEVLCGLTLKSAPVLLAFVERQNWRSVDADTRFIALHEINLAITRLRERAGMAPFDDPLDGRLNVFQRAKALLFPV